MQDAEREDPGEVAGDRAAGTPDRGQEDRELDDVDRRHAPEHHAADTRDRGLGSDEEAAQAEGPGEDQDDLAGVHASPPSRPQPASWRRFR